jgi:hypothetical protein
MSLSFKDRLAISLATNTAAGLFKLWFKTCPVKITRPEIYEKWALSDRQVIAATWHRSAVYFVYHFGFIHPMIMFSRSKDGEYLTRFAQSFGVKPVRGSSSRGGALPEKRREGLRHSPGWTQRTCPGGQERDDCFSHGNRGTHHSYHLVGPQGLDLPKELGQDYDP